MEGLRFHRFGEADGIFKITQGRVLVLALRDLSEYIKTAEQNAYSVQFQYYSNVLAEW